MRGHRVPVALPALLRAGQIAAVDVHNIVVPQRDQVLDGKTGTLVVCGVDGIDPSMAGAPPDLHRGQLARELNQ